MKMTEETEIETPSVPNPYIDLALLHIAQASEQVTQSGESFALLLDAVLFGASIPHFLVQSAGMPYDQTYTLFQSFVYWVQSTLEQLEAESSTTIPPYTQH